MGQADGQSGAVRARGAAIARAATDATAPPVRAERLGGMPIPALTGVRGIAALWVVFHHVRPYPASLEEFCQPAYLGVDLFAFLSGFVIAHNYGERLARPRAAETYAYWWARFARIGPLYYLALALLALALVSIPGFGTRHADGDWYGLRELAKQLFMVQGWGIGNLAWNLPSWTVSTEWLCYLVFPLLAPALMAVHDGRACIGLAALTLAVTVAAVTASGHPDLNASVHGGILRIGGEFLVGCWLQRAWRAGWGAGAPWPLLGPLALTSALAFLVHGIPVGVVACFAVLVYALASGGGGLGRALGSRPACFFGEASYALYILHWVVLRVLAYTAPDRFGGDRLAQVLGDVPIAVAVALAVHVALENPARRRLRGWLPAPDRSASAALAPRPLGAAAGPTA